MLRNGAISVPNLLLLLILLPIYVLFLPIVIN